MGRLFGTDGVRGVAGEDLTGQLAMDLATAAAGMLQDMRAAAAGRSNGSRLVAVVGRDPRASGEFLEAAVVAGLAGAGVDVLRLGVIPTPGVAYLTAALGADLGVMLSASHNPAPDNGIKLFARGGFKLPDAAEDEIEARMALPGRTGRLPAGGFGRVRDATGERERYLAHLLASQPGTGDLSAAHVASAMTRGTATLAGLRVVVDCAHGAASALAPELLRRAGAEVIAIGAEPDGENINADCGSTHLEVLSAAVTKHGADAGIAHDGDADRCLAVDATGEMIDGDQILAVLALELKARGRAGRRHRGGHGHVQPGLPQGHGEGRDHRGGDRGRRPVRAGGDAGRALRASAASSPGTSSCSTTPPPATACSPPCTCSRPPPASGSPWRTWPG